MELNGKELFHKKFGKGIIKSCSENTVIIDFNGSERKFALNSIFIKLIKGDAKLISYIGEIVNNIESKTEKERSEKIAHIERKLAHAKALNNRKDVFKTDDRLNIAVNAVYCDGGKNESSMGFNGICSDAVLEENIGASDGRWCTKHNCRCNIYGENKSTSTRIELERLMEDDGFVCHESRMLRDWVIVAGTDNNRVPRRLDTSNGKLCVLTTVAKGDVEDSRCIFALYIIENIDEDINGISQLWAESYYRYAFSPDIAKKLCFWDFVKTEGEPEWGNDKFICLSNDICINIVKKAAELTGDNRLNAILDYYMELNGYSER